MKWLYLDIFAGISGDMFLGVLVDLGLPLSVLEDTIAGLGLQGEVHITTQRVHKNGIAATKVTVTVHGEPDTPQGHNHVASPHASHPHGHTSLETILHRIAQARLPETVRLRASQVFRRLAEAEARVHGVSVDTVHFHEVGALDAVVDVVGAVAGLHALGIHRVMASPIPVAHGFVNTAHGSLPVPAPATMALLEGVPIRGQDLAAETVTPTGAALVTTLTDTYGPPPPMRVERVGYGAGTMDLPIPNVLRAWIGTPQPDDGETMDVHTLNVLETNIDDMPGEWFGSLFGRLLDAGALDVWLTPVQMKKGRPGVVVTVLTPPEKAPHVRALLLRETTTLGVRETLVTRWCVPREKHTVETRWGPVPVKIAHVPDAPPRVKPEYDVCSRLAQEHNVPVWQVIQDALRAAQEAIASRKLSPP